MGEPGTPDLVKLEDLEASSALSGRKHILSLLVENKPGVLARIAGLFSRRGFNIDTLAVGPTEDPDISRVTLTLDGAVHPIDQVTKQLHKLINVIKIRDMEPDGTVAREMALFRVNAAVENRGEIMQFARSSTRTSSTSRAGHSRSRSPARRTRSTPSSAWCAPRPDRDGPYGEVAITKSAPTPDGRITLGSRSPQDLMTKTIEMLVERLDALAERWDGRSLAV